MNNNIGSRNNLSTANIDALSFNNSNEYKSQLMSKNYNTYTHPSILTTRSTKMDDVPANRTISFDEVPFLAFQEHRKKYHGIAEEAYKTFGTDCKLSELFFSYQNVIKVQKGLTYYVKKATKNKILIDDQPLEDIIVQMQYRYYTYGKFLQTNVEQQVRELNIITIKELIPEVITQIKQQLGYIRAISRPPDVMDQPINISKTGRKTLPSVSNIIFAAQYPGGNSNIY
jgi:hypothetical protein